jgi:hypothetical protein
MPNRNEASEILREMDEALGPLAKPREFTPVHFSPAPKAPTRYVAWQRIVKLGAVTICRCPSHEKAKKLARLFNAFPVMREALRESIDASVQIRSNCANGEWLEDNLLPQLSRITRGADALGKADAV